MTTLARGLLASILLLWLAACGEPAAQTEAAPAAPEAALAATAAVQEQAPAPSVSPAVWAHEESDLAPDPAVRFGVLENGFRYVLMANDTPTDLAAVWLVIESGGLHEEDDQQGLAHLLEHMAFNGSENVTEGEMRRMLERLGMAFGPDTNAFTSIPLTGYTLNLQNTADETLDTAFFILGETADKLTLDPAAVDRERPVVVAERRGGNPVARARQNAIMAFFFPDHRLGERDVIGLPEIIEGAPVERIRDYYETWYRPDNAALVVVGDVDLDAIETRVRETFAAWERPAEPLPRPDLGTIEAGRAPAAAVFVDPGTINDVTLAVVSPAGAGPDTLAWRKREATSVIAAMILSRRLFAIASQADAPFASAQAGVSKRYQGAADLAQITARTSEGGWRRALEAIEQELRRAIEHGFTEAELQEEVARLMASIKAQADSADTRNSLQLVSSFVSDISQDRVILNPRTVFEHASAFTAELTVEDVNAAFREDWGGSGPLAFVSSTTPIEGGEAVVLEALAASRSVPVEPPAAREKAEFAYTDFGSPGAIASRTEIEDLGITQVVFENGVRLNVKRTDYQDDVVRVALSLGQGRAQFVSAEAPSALQQVATGGMSLGGLGAHSVDEMISIFAGQTVQATLAFNAFDDRFMAAAQTKPDLLPLQLQIIAAYLTDPGFREEGLARFRRSVEAAYDTIDDTPQAVEQLFALPLVQGGAPVFAWPAKEALLGLDFEAARAAMRPALAESYLEVGVVGDVDVEAVIAAAAATLGALPARADAPAPPDPAAAARFPEPTAEPVVLRHDGGADQARVLTYWPVTDDSDPRLEWTMELVRRVLGDKLIDRVREADGVSYGPGAALAMSGVHEGFGYIRAGLDLTPDTASAYFAVIDEIAAEMAAGGIDDDALLRARTPLLETLGPREENNGYWADLLSRAQREPRRLDEHRNDRAQIESITREEVVAAAATYLDPAKAFRVVILPNPE